MAAIGKQKAISSAAKTDVSVAAYKNLQIGQPVGKPSVSKSKIVAAVRTVMKEDGMI